MKSTLLHIKIIFSIFLLSFIFSLSADENSHRQAAADLLDVTQAANTVTTYIQQLELGFSAMPMYQGMNEEQLKITRAYQNNILSLIKETISWEKIKPDFITLYTSAYSEEDLKELTRFYESRLGQSTLKKTPLIMQKSMQITQLNMQKIMPEIHKSTQEMMMELQKLGNQHPN